MTINSYRSRPAAERFARDLTEHFGQSFKVFGEPTGFGYSVGYIQESGRVAYAARRTPRHTWAAPPMRLRTVRAAYLQRRTPLD